MTHVGTFRYTARTMDGDGVSGVMCATNAAGVVALLRRRSLVVTSVTPEQNFVGHMRRLIGFGRVKRPALLGFFRSFVTLLRAGVPIGRALRVAVDSATSTAFREALRSILADVESGAALSDALGRRPYDFPELYVEMIRAGEAGGILDDVLERLALLLEREAALWRSLRAAFTYPLIVILAAGTLIVFLLANIVPMFAQMFASFQVDLPPTTQALLAFSSWLATPVPWTICALAGPALAVGFARLRRSTQGALLLDDLRLRLPVVGPLLRKAIVARTSRLLATLLRSGVELVNAIESILPVTGSPRYALAFARVNADLRAGGALAPALDAVQLFDPLFLELLHVGEETGLVDEMLLQIAGYFEADVESGIAILGTIIEPALIVVLGGGVGFIVLSIFLPLYSLIGGVAK